ncbi:hypothetical protein AXYL_02727 [Achromobacter xylosoxidans A8]|uniref:Uncharacterized protein n=1 Tax=Achromobacter xylosoxidans (strain A8) TaxID=762376 RepID=E3HSA1_ACHXA|nr:hypothetical protein AXYL_02727 [Achromobacter xylosoxidans A8]
MLKPSLSATTLDHKRLSCLLQGAYGRSHGKTQPHTFPTSTPAPDRSGLALQYSINNVDDLLFISERI